MTAPTIPYFTHEIDQQTYHCIRCGKFLKELQENREFRANTVHPLCRDDVTAISHIRRVR